MPSLQCMFWFLPCVLVGLVLTRDVRALWFQLLFVGDAAWPPRVSVFPAASIHLILTFSMQVISPDINPRWSWRIESTRMVPTFTLWRRVSPHERRSSQWYQVSILILWHSLFSPDYSIRPANILLSHKNIPVMVDFGFAEKYDTSSDTAFHSNLSYGTPEVGKVLPINYRLVFTFA